MADNTISSRIDELLSRDITNLSPEEIVSIVTGGEPLPEYIDPQSEEGFNKELEKTEKEVQDIIKSLETQKLPIPLESIENLACNLEGDELYTEVLLESIKVKDPNLYEEIKKSPEFIDSQKIESKDLGISSNIKSLNVRSNKPSSGIVRFMENKNPDLLRDVNESLFDNLDPLLFGKPSNSGSKKRRSLKILGFTIPLEFIMAKGKILHVKILGPDLTIDQAKERIKKSTDAQKKNTKPCDSMEKTDTDGNPLGPNDQKIVGGVGPVEGGDDGDYGKLEDSGLGADINFFQGDDPLINPDCDPVVPEDPITGDPIATVENFDAISNDFCDPPEADFTNQLDEDPEPTGPDFTQDQINSIQTCLDSALEKQDSLDKKTLSLARWRNVERFLEEIYFHYDIVFEYQKTLYNTWIARKGIVLPGNGSTSAPIGIAIKILTLLEQISQTETQLFSVNKSLDDYKRIFLENNKIFNQNLFSLNPADTELNYQQITDLFQEKADANVSPVNFNEETKKFPITEGVNLFFSKIQDIRNILLRKNEVNLLTKNFNELNSEKDINVNSLSSILKKPVVSLDDLESIFKNALNWSPSTRVSQAQEFAKGVFDAPLITNNTGNGYQGYGYNFIKNLEKFSARFSSAQFNSSDSELKIELSLFTDFGNPLPYVTKQKPGKLSITGDSTPFFKTVSDPDIERIKIGNEHAGNGGILSDYPSDYLRSNNFLSIKNIKEGESDVADFYDFLNDVISTGLSKETIIENIKTKRGVLYAKLIEKSASNWLFFTADERGDNDARNPANLKPASFDANGEPTPVFTEFWSNFKTKWDEKYTQTKNQDIVPEVNKMKEYARKAGLGLGSVISISDITGIRVVENYFSTKKKIEQVEELILIAAQKRQEIEDQVTPQSIEADFSGIKCAVSSGAGGAGDAGNIPGPETPCSESNCPPKCCGEAGSDFKSDNYLLSAPPSSDCPTIFSKCWLKQFCKHLTTVGLLPYPNGLPPIEKTSFFLGGGPSVRLGLKYWPVGYLPPAFIPIPIANPVDGKPYIRVPLPMVWTIIPPVVIPLPLNLGTLIIFIPLIGGFMPTPLFFIKENINGTSFFLTGLRGPRFIPRKSDPKILDPLEKIKQIISFGFPDKLLPLPGFGLDNQDSLTRILENIQSNLVKILDGVPGPGNLDSLRELQQKEANLKSSINAKKDDYNKKYALLDIPKPNTESETNALKSIPAERKDVLTKVISRYLKKGIPNPKSIYYPKDKDSLKIDTPGVVKSIRDIKDNISNLSPVTPPSTINLKDVFKDVLKNANVNIPSEYALDNQNLSVANRIVLKALKDPREMNEEEFKDFVSKIRKQSTDVVKQMVDGNNLSIIESRKKGALAQLELAKFQGTFEFPPADAVCPPPKALKYNLVPNPLLDQIKVKLNQGIANAPFNPEDFSKYVRVGDNGVNTVIRVKDLKKIVSSKLGLSKKNPGDLERPIDSIDSLLKNFPFPNAPLTSELIMSNSFGTAISAFELPTAFPLKQDQITQTFGAGGIVQTTIPGTVIKNFIVKSVETGMKNGMLEKYFPEINDINSSKFVNLEPQDIQKMTRSMITEVLDPNSPNVPDFLRVVNIPILPKARPTDMVEQVLVGLGVPPPARIVYSLFWKYFKGLPKSPLPEIVTEPVINTAAKVLTKIPWPVTVLLGRNVINIINPMCLSDDHPSWRRMSLKNAYYVVYIDEFLRSAADVSGLFKFFFGDSVYPIPEFREELSKVFNIKKY